MARRRRPFSTPRAARVLTEARGVRGFSRRRAERVYQLTVDHFARNRGRINDLTSVRSFESVAAQQEADIEEIVAAYVPGLFEAIAWVVAKYFVRWLVRRLVQEWSDSPTEFRQVVEDLD